MRKSFLVLMAAILSALLCPSASAFTLKHFDTPESFIVDPEDGSYYVSNINGDISKKDANGYISKISPRGNSVIQFFIGAYSGSVLDAPKGLVVMGRDLIVADIDTVKIFDKFSGKIKKSLDLSGLGAQFLNDVAVDNSQHVYISDTIGNQIFVLDAAKDYQPKIYLKGRALGQPNGLKYNPRSKSLIIVTYGSGELLEIDAFRGLHVLKRGMAALDGIDYDNNGNLFVSSFAKGEIYKIPNYGRGIFTTFASGLTTPADISVDRSKNEVLIPSFNGGQVLTMPITAATTAPSKKSQKPAIKPIKKEINNNFKSVFAK